MKLSPTKAVNELIVALSYAIDIEENTNIYHGWRVASLSAHIAKGLTSKTQLKDIFYAACLHDCGAVEFMHHITYYLKRKDKQTRQLLLSHPILGAQLASNIPNITNAAKLILDHHEWVNGSGYPRAKAKKYIPLGSQILRISDSIDVALQNSHILKLKKLKHLLSPNINKEFSQELFKKAIAVLKKDNFFSTISKRRNMPQVFKETLNMVGTIRISSRIDAVGKTLEAASQIIDMKHPFTAGHSLRVSRYAMAYALATNLAHDEVTKIKWASLIHDIGKLGVPRSILDKNTPLTQKEFAEIKKHVILGQEIMGLTPSLKELLPIAVMHHEHFDGSGYPLGLKAEQIPLGARILSVCDAFDAMTSNRPYRKPFNIQEACREIKNRSGSQFDPQVVKNCLPIFKNLYL